MYKQGFSQKLIAETIKKDKSVVSRELRRNRNDRGEYSFTHVQMLADVRKNRLWRERTFTGEVENRINRYMRKWQWSPEQIVGHCRLKGVRGAHLPIHPQGQGRGRRPLQELPPPAQAPQAARGRPCPRQGQGEH